MATIEFYIGDSEKYIISLESDAVPRQGEFINIKKKTFEILHVTWAIDYSEDNSRKRLRANVELKRSDK